MSDKKLVVVVVKGVPTAVHYHGNPTLQDIAIEALAQTQNSGQPIENWELRLADGQLLPHLNEHLNKLDLPDGAELFLNLRAGVGG